MLPHRQEGHSARGSNTSRDYRDRERERESREVELGVGIRERLQHDDTRRGSNPSLSLGGPTSLPRPQSSSSRLFSHVLPPPAPGRGPPPLSGKTFYPPSPHGYREQPSPFIPMDAPWNDRPPSSRAGLSSAGDRGDSRGGRWSPTLPGLSPRTYDPVHRLPPLNDFPHRGWDQPPSTGYSISSRPPTSYDYRPGSAHFAHHPPSGLPTPSSNHERERDQPEDVRERGSARAYSDIDTPGDRSPGPSSGKQNDEAGSKKKKRRVALSCAECAKVCTISSSR